MTYDGYNEMVEQVLKHIKLAERHEMAEGRCVRNVHFVVKVK